MNKFALIIPALIVLTGCKSNDITRAVKDGINGAVNGVSSSTNQSITSSNQSSYTTTQTKVLAYKATKEARNYGQITIASTAENPKKQTRVAINKCLHPRVGEVKCKAYMYEISPKGWLIDAQSNRIWLETRSTHFDKVIPSGSYYMKVRTEGVAKESYATGDINIVPFVTNYVDITFE